MDFAAYNPELVATTGTTYSCSIKESAHRETRPRDTTPLSAPLSEPTTAEDSGESNYFKSIQWCVLYAFIFSNIANESARSPDGTSLITSSADNKLRFFVAPPDLLSPPSSSPHTLEPYTTYSTPETTYAQAFYPSFTLQEPSTTLLLSSPRDHPIQIVNVLSPTPSPIASYPLICPTTEAFLTPSSLLWHPSGNSFFTGTDSLITIFDVSRPGEGPTTRLPTIPSKRHKMKGGGVGMRGIVSCLSFQPSSPDGVSASSMLAAGTWTRWVSLYDAEGLGGTVANWSIASAADDEAKIGGAGVSQVLWSACGRYLFVVERKSQGVLIYDVRVTGRLVGWLEGRQADTNQRMSVDIATMDGGSVVWAGGTDGKVRGWRDVEGKEGGIQPDMEWLAHEAGTALGGVAMHSCGSVLATASGMRREELSNSDDESDSESMSEDESFVEDVDGNYKKHAASSRSISSSPTLENTPHDNSIKIWNLF